MTSSKSHLLTLLFNALQWQRKIKNNNNKKLCVKKNLEMGKFLRDSRNIRTIKSFPIMNLKEGMTFNLSLYIGFC